MITCNNASASVCKEKRMSFIEFELPKMYKYPVFVPPLLVVMTSMLHCNLSLNIYTNLLVNQDKTIMLDVIEIVEREHTR